VGGGTGHLVVIENFKELTTKVPMMGEISHNDFGVLGWFQFSRESVNYLSPNTYNQIKGTQNNQKKIHIHWSHISYNKGCVHIMALPFTLKN